MTRSIGFHHMGLGEEATSGAWRSLGDLTDAECERIAAEIEKDRIRNARYSLNGVVDDGPYNEDDR